MHGTYKPVRLAEPQVIYASRTETAWRLPSGEVEVYKHKPTHKRKEKRQ